MGISREWWCGYESRTGALKRLRGTVIALSFAVVVIGYRSTSGANAVYAMMVAAHALAYTGFAVATGADAFARRPFSWVRFGLTLSVGFCYMMSGPILMSAVAASRYHRP